MVDRPTLDPPRRAAPFAAFALLALVLTGATLAQWSPALDSYDSDWWTYLLIVERTAAGESVAEREPFRLEPPAAPHNSALWSALGAVRRNTQAHPVTLARALSLLAIALTAAAAWLLAGVGLARAWERALAVALLFLAFPETWASLGLSRHLGFAVALLAARQALAGGSSSLAAVVTGALVGAAAHLHPLDGVVALVLAALAIGVRRRFLTALPTRSVALVLLTAIVCVLPLVRGALATAGLPYNASHVMRPDQIHWGGTLLLDPRSLREVLPWPLLALACFGLVVRCAPPLGALQALVRVSSAIAFVVLFTPLFGIAVKVVGGWLAPRFVGLALPWLAAAIGAAALLRTASRTRRTLAIALLALLSAGRLDRLHADFRGAVAGFAFEASAQDEALSLRPLLRGQGFVSQESIAYGLTALTLGRPIAVPPGHASPYADFVRAQRRVQRALGINSASCWTALLDQYPDTRFVVLPGDPGTRESALWRESGAREPREVLRSLGAVARLRQVHGGRHFQVWQIEERLPLPPDAAGRGCGQR